MQYLPAQLSESHPIFSALAEIQKPRSRFQLERFVVGQHDTPEQQYKQTLLEIQNLYYTIKTVNLSIKKDLIEIDRLRSTGDEVDEIDAQIKELGLEQTRLVALGAQRELEDLIKIWESFDHKYTYEEMEERQPEYWSARLTRQAQLEAMGSGGKVAWASLDALRQVGELEVPTTQEIETEQAKELDNGN